jgi:nitrogen fixation protein NifB
MNLKNHPCFNKGAHGKFGRVHLPVAPRCNIQCKFCNRKFDCVNESRPGVTSGVLSPEQAMVYLAEVFKRKKNISVVGIAGPGDPFANPEETMETLRLVREEYPELMLCVATNGLNLLPYVDELARLEVSHVTVTVNAVDPVVGEKIYSWVRYNKRALKAFVGAGILLEKQLAAINALKAKDIVVKINSIILPGVNDQHIPAVAEKMAAMEVDLMNCVPIHPAPDSTFEKFEEPPKEMVNKIRGYCESLIPQMRHCTRCRADAVGLLGEAPDQGLMNVLTACKETTPVLTQRRIASPAKKNVAVASLEGVFVNQHLGEAPKLMVYGEKDGAVTLLGARQTPDKGSGVKRWAELALTFSDCHTILVSGVGETPRRALADAGIETIEVEGLIDDAVAAVMKGESLRHMIKRAVSSCSGGRGGGGCC